MDYLDDFDNHCASVSCQECHLRPYHDLHREKSCFRIYCESRDAKKNGVPYPPAGEKTS